MTDRYEIKGKIGQGGIGAVYRAWDRRLNREVAIKRVLPEGGFENQDEAIAHLLKEATSLSSVQHPHIVTVYDAGVDEEGPYVVMELLEGRTLDEMIERGTLTAPDFREVAVQTQEALIAAQDLNLVHRDLKPTNVMVTWAPSGKFQMKLVDFGLAKFSPKPSLQTIDHGDAVFGSIHFMAPEQFERTPLDQRTDMYAMGCMYYYGLTGEHPFTGETAPEVMASHLQHRVQPLHEQRPDLPRWLCDWVMWHVERQMDDRPSNARESLQKFLMTEQSTPDNQDEAPQPQRPKFVFPGAEGAKDPAPATPATTPAPITPPAPGPTPASPAPGELPTGTAPQPILPPEGQKPSIHTTSQVTASQPPAATPDPVPAPPVQPATPAPPIQPATPAPPVQPATPAPPIQPATPAAAPAPAPPVQPAAPAPAPQIKLAGAPTPAPASQAPTPAPAPAPGAVLPAGGPATAGQPGRPAGASTVITGSTAMQTRKGMSNAAKITIAAVLAVAVIIAGVVVFAKMGSNKQAKYITGLLAQVEDSGAKDIPTTEADANALLSGAVSLAASKQREAFYQRLLVAKSSDGSDLDALIASYAANEQNEMASDIRIKLFQVIQGRRGPSALPFLIEHAQSSRSAQTATAALKAAEKLATEKDLAPLLKIIQFTDHPQVRQAAKNTIASLATRTEAGPKLATAVLQSYENATSDGAKLIFIELLGSAGGDKAAEIVSGLLESKDQKLRLAAIAALGAWPDDTEFETLVDYMGGEENDMLRGKAFDAAFAFVRLERERDELDREDMWKYLARSAETRQEKEKLITGLARYTDDWSYTIVEFFEADEDSNVSRRAEQALERMDDRRERLEKNASDKEDEPEEEKDEDPKEEDDSDGDDGSGDEEKSDDDDS